MFPCKMKKICFKCNKKIDEKKDEWFENVLYKKGKKDSVVYFHRVCYQNFHKDKFKEEYQKKMKLLQPIMKNMLGGIKN